MSRYTRATKIAASVLLLILIALFGAIILYHHERSRAEQLAAQIKLLAVGTTVIDANHLIRLFAGRKVEFPPSKYGSGNLVLGIRPCSDADANRSLSLQWLRFDISPNGTPGQLRVPHLGVGR